MRSSTAEELRQLASSATGAVVSSRFSERLEGVTVADVMDTQPVWVPGDTTVLQAQDEFFLRYRWPWFPVADPISAKQMDALARNCAQYGIRLYAMGAPGQTNARNYASDYYVVISPSTGTAISSRKKRPSAVMGR